MSTKRNRRLRRAILIGVIACAGGVALAQAVSEVWVNRANVPVFNDEGAASGRLMDPSGKTAITLKKGDKLTVLSRDGDWLKVQVGTQQGYVFAKSISDKQVAADSGGIFGSADASQQTSAAAGKGFAESKDTLAYANSKNLSHVGLDNLQRLTAKVDFADWKQFMKDGQVGRYRQK